jgi:hypothetical protein
MTELARLSQILIDEVPARRPNLAELRARSHKRQLRRGSLAVGVLVVVVIVAFSAIYTQRAPSTNDSPRTQLASYYEAAVNVSNSTLAAVGLPPTVAIPTRVNPSLSTVATNGVVSYVGAEYCPYCAVQRWALLVALSKFGAFTHLDNEVFSSSSDVYPHLASWSFVGATYASKYFTFDPTELTSTKPSRTGAGGYQRLEQMSGAQHVAFSKFNSDGSIPFVDFGNHYVTIGASSSPSVLQGLSLGQIGSDLNRPKSPVARAIDGSANYMIAALCTMANKTPPALCSTNVIRSASRSLDTGTSSSTEGSGLNKSPVQPPMNAPLAVWKKWSAAEHDSLLRWAATYRSPDSGCTVKSISVTGRKLTKPLFGVPAGVWEWSVSVVGRCPTGKSGDLVKPAS